ncbi:hypothetical protein [Micromonospora chokoriensis]|uniref:hypothetical protein n=1 Tax=Micromonospora chokoriensis TaxID=356851 RepID=UPI000AAAC6DC|nr:hypothetical protein [Micromonospora chokoriensis]
MAERKSLPKFEVIGPCRVAGAEKGETVQLDPAEVNIDALIEAGHIRPVKRTGGQA